MRPGVLERERESLVERKVPTRTVFKTQEDILEAIRSLDIPAANVDTSPLLKHIDQTLTGPQGEEPQPEPRCVIERLEEIERRLDEYARLLGHPAMQSRDSTGYVGHTGLYHKLYNALLTQQAMTRAAQECLAYTTPMADLELYITLCTVQNKANDGLYAGRNTSVVFNPLVDPDVRDWAWKLVKYETDLGIPQCWLYCLHNVETPTHTFKHGLDPTLTGPEAHTAYRLALRELQYAEDIGVRTTFGVQWMRGDFDPLAQPELEQFGYLAAIEATDPGLVAVAEHIQEAADTDAPRVGQGAVGELQIRRQAVRMVAREPVTHEASSGGSSSLQDGSMMSSLILYNIAAKIGPVMRQIPEELGLHALVLRVMQAVTANRIDQCIWDPGAGWESFIYNKLPIEMGTPPSYCIRIEGTKDGQYVERSLLSRPLPGQPDPSGINAPLPSDGHNISDICDGLSIRYATVLVYGPEVLEYATGTANYEISIYANELDPSELQSTYEGTQLELLIQARRLERHVAIRASYPNPIIRYVKPGVRSLVDIDYLSKRDW
ncbi:MAG: hypothetical protein LBJ69_03680 [Holosporales bacterium]|nr:hypothetical protein [Holosporales bacterium]